MAYTTSAKNAILSATLGKSSGATLGSNCYMGLSSTVPNADGGNFTELSGYGYARAIIGKYSEATTQVMATPSGGSTSNEKIIFFPEITGAIGTAVAVGLFSVPTGGTPFDVAELSAPVTLSSGHVPMFPVGTCTYSMG